MTSAAPPVSELQAVARRIRRHIVEMVHAAQSGHPGGSLSSVEILTALYLGGVARHDPARPDWPQRDRVLVSKGHATPVVYAVLAEAGYIDAGSLSTFRKLDSVLQGHVVRGKPVGVEMSAGALGMGLSFANGLALAGKMDRADWRVYCLVGDGELNEGQNWEAIMSAAHFQFDHITAIVDRNRIQNDGAGDEIMGIDPLPEKWRAFGWHVIEIADGHSIQQMLDAYAEAKSIKGRPQVIIAPTVKGKGVSFMEATPAAWHGKAPSDAELAQALEEIGV